MMEYHITKETASLALREAVGALETGKQYLCTISEKSSEKWAMSKLWRKWMSEVAEWMAARGATMPLFIRPDGTHYGTRPFNAEDCHQLFTTQYLGTDADGLRLSWSRQGRDGMRPASKGERLYAMQRLEAWATEKGIILTNPRDSEYRKLNEQ